MTEREMDTKSFNNSEDRFRRKVEETTEESGLVRDPTRIPQNA